MQAPFSHVWSLGQTIVVIDGFDAVTVAMLPEQVYSLSVVEFKQVSGFAVLVPIAVAVIVTLPLVPAIEPPSLSMHV